MDCMAFNPIQMLRLSDKMTGRWQDDYEMIRQWWRGDETMMRRWWDDDETMIWWREDHETMTRIWWGNDMIMRRWRDDEPNSHVETIWYVWSVYVFKSHFWTLSDPIQYFTLITAYEKHKFSTHLDFLKVSNRSVSFIQQTKSFHIWQETPHNLLTNAAIVRALAGPKALFLTGPIPSIIQKLGHAHSANRCSFVLTF